MFGYPAGGVTVKLLGTILPVKDDLARADRHADKMKANELLEAEKELVGLEKRIVGGEVRYYKSDTIYTPALKKFEVRSDGDYSVKNN
jgi:hypothetical protein